VYNGEGVGTIALAPDIDLRELVDLRSRDAEIARVEICEGDKNKTDSRGQWGEK
jgi:hypothetical protein